MPTVWIFHYLRGPGVVRMTSHGIIQPNPALYDLESWRPRHVLAHETGQEVRESVSVAAGKKSVLGSDWRNI